MSNLGNELTCRSYWLEDYYEPFSVRVISALEGNLDVFLDVGTNVGVFALFAASEPKPPRVVAFEPNPLMRSALEENRDLNGFDIDISALALSDESGEAEFFQPESVTSGSLDREFNPDFVDSYCVDVSTLDEFSEGSDILSEGDRVLVKMDVLGHESAVLRGAREFTKRWIPTYLLEAVRRYDSAEVEFLRRLGYQFFRLLPSGLEKTDQLQSKESDGFAFANLIATADEDLPDLISAEIHAAAPTLLLEETSLQGFVAER